MRSLGSIGYPKNGVDGDFPSAPENSLGRDERST